MKSTIKVIHGYPLEPGMSKFALPPLSNFLGVGTLRFTNPDNPKVCEEKPCVWIECPTEPVSAGYFSGTEEPAEILETKTFVSILAGQPFEFPPNAIFRGLVQFRPMPNLKPNEFASIFVYEMIAPQSQEVGQTKLVTGTASII